MSGLACKAGRFFRSGSSRLPGLLAEYISGRLDRYRPDERSKIVLATFRRKIHDFRDDATWPPARQTRRDSPAGFTIAAVRRAVYGSPWFWIARPILMRLSASTPSPTQRLMPTSPRYRQRLRPCRRLATLMRS